MEHPALDPEDPFRVPWPVRLGLKSGMSSCILCVGLGSAFPEFGEASAVGRDALDDFLKLENPKDCQAFATRWGLLGNWQNGSRWHAIPDSCDAKIRIAVGQELLEKELLRAGANGSQRLGIWGATGSMAMARLSASDLAEYAPHLEL